MECLAKQLEDEDFSREDTDILESIPRLVTEYHNDLLASTPSGEDIRQALFSLNPLSVPGSDGLTAHFYQFC